LIISILKNLAKVYSKSNFKYYYFFYISILISLLLSVAEATFVGSIYVLIQNITDISNNNYQFNNKIYLFIKDFFNIDFLSLSIILPGLIIIVITILKVLNIFINTFLFYKINTLISSQIFFKTINQELKFHNKMNSSLFISAIIQKAKSVGEITFFLSGIIKSSLTLGAVTFLAIYISSKFFLLFFIFFLLIFLFIYWILKKKIKNIGIQVALFNDKVLKILQENYSSIIFIILYNCQKAVNKTFNEAVKNLRISESKVVFLSSVPYIFIQTLTVLFILFFIYFYDLKNNFSVMLPLVGMWLLAIQRLIPSFNEIFSSLSTIKGANQNFLDTINFLNLSSQDTLLKNQKSNLNFKEQILFQNISHSYSGNLNLVLKKINFKIKKNSIVGIKGDSGSGKSTLIAILMGYYEPTEGYVLIDEKKLSKQNTISWQEKISYVPQKVFLFDDSIKNNIAFAEEKINEIYMKQSIQVAELEDYINSTNNGLETLLGENAIRISVGQKQRIGIARAIYKNTNILILDESLNSLDYNTKNKILENIRKLNKTVVLISHDENDLKICSSILDLNNYK
jgi:ABC-type multidrug transport system fused ATPase/permease subunit